MTDIFDDDSASRQSCKSTEPAGIDGDPCDSMFQDAQSAASRSPLPSQEPVLSVGDLMGEVNERPHTREHTADAAAGTQGTNDVRGMSPERNTAVPMTPVTSDRGASAVGEAFLMQQIDDAATSLSMEAVRTQDVRNESEPFKALNAKNETLLAQLTELLSSGGFSSAHRLTQRMKHELKGTPKIAHYNKLEKVTDRTAFRLEWAKERKVKVTEVIRQRKKSIKRLTRPRGVIARSPSSSNGRAATTTPSAQRSSTAKRQSKWVGNGSATTR